MTGPGELLIPIQHLPNDIRRQMRCDGLEAQTTRDCLTWFAFSVAKVAKKDDLNLQLVRGALTQRLGAGLK